MPAHGTQVRVWVSRRRAWVTAGDHRAERRATPRAVPTRRFPSRTGPAYATLMALSPCRLQDGSCAVVVVCHCLASARAPGPPGARTPRVPAVHRGQRPGPGACGQRWHGRWPRAWDEARCVHTGWRARHVRALRRVRVDGHRVTPQSQRIPLMATLRTALPFDLAHPPAVPAAHE